MLQIRTCSDAQLLAQLNRPVQTFHALTYPERFKPFRQKEMAAAFEALCKKKNWFFFVIWSKSDPLGYIALEVKKKPANAFKYAEDVLYIDQLAVQEAHRRKGIGNLLLHRAIQFAKSKGIASIEADHWNQNEEAKLFFAHSGFETIRSQCHLRIQ